MRKKLIEAAILGTAFVVLMGLLLSAPDQVKAQQNPGPSWTCSLDNIGATLTFCKIASEPGTRRFITDIVAQSTTATAGQFILRTGTGSNCGTGTASLFPSAATVIRFSAPANTAAPTTISFRTPLEVPIDKDLCMLGVGTNTVTIQIQGYLGS